MERPGPGSSSDNEEAPGIEEPASGIPKSGRPWKNTRKSKHSAMKRDKPSHTSWAKKKELRDQKHTVKSIQDEITGARRASNLEKKRIREERKQKKLENERRAEIVVQVKNVHKLKRMKKKQLRMIEKRADD